MQSRELSAKPVVFLLRPATFYVTAHRPRKPPAIAAPLSRRHSNSSLLLYFLTSLLLACCKLVSLGSTLRTRPFARRARQPAQSTQHRRRRPCHEQLRLPPSSRGKPL